MEYGYFSKDVALKLDINASTLRQWCLAIEKEGYEISKNDKDQRIFYERDINMLFELKSLIEKTRNRSNAIKSVVSRYNSPINDINPPSVNQDNGVNDEVVNQLLDHIQKQEKFNQELLKRLDEQQQYIEGMNEALNQSMETQKQLAAAQEEKKSFFAKLFKK